MNNNNYKTWVDKASSILDSWRAEVVLNAKVESIEVRDGRGFNLKVIIDGKGYELNCWLDAFQECKFSELVSEIRNR